MAKKKPAMSPSDMPVHEVLDRVSGPRRHEADVLLQMHSEVSGEAPVVWAGRIIGFGEYEYRYESGHSGTAPLLGFATGVNHHTVYLVNDFAERWPDLVDRLGPNRATKACLHITRLSRVDTAVLRHLLELSYEDTRSAWR